MKKVIVMTVALLTLTACDNQKTAMLDHNKANWDVIAAAEGKSSPRVKNSFLIFMR